LAALIGTRLGLEVELIRGGGGIFDIHADGKPVYLKSQTGDFPSEEEVIAKLEKMRG